MLADLESTQPTRWIVRTLRPGQSPMAALGDVLGADVADARRRPRRSLRAAQQSIAAESAAGRLLLVVDQLEELFTQASTRRPGSFIAALTGFTSSDVSIVLAIRADFYGELMESALWSLVGTARSTCRRSPAPPSPRQSRSRRRHATSARAGSARAARSDAGSEPGALPLLQEALVRLWGTMQLHRISLAAYESIGGEGRDGLSAAVADTADAALASLSPEQVPIAKRVLLRLVQFGQGRPDTRRQLRVGELRSEGDDDRALEVVLEVLANSRLVTLTGAASPARRPTLQGRRPSSISPTRR